MEMPKCVVRCEQDHPPRERVSAEFKQRAISSLNPLRNIAVAAGVRFL